MLQFSSMRNMVKVEPYSKQAGKYKTVYCGSMSGFYLFVSNKFLPTTWYAWKMQQKLKGGENCVQYTDWYDTCAYAINSLLKS